MKLVLASSSVYRARLLKQLGLPFDTVSPDIDESPQGAEAPRDYVHRLALEKARAVKASYPEALVIGSDQTCSLQGLPLGKPGTEQAAFKHLKLCAGNEVEFLTGLALVNTATGKERVAVESYRVRFRALTDDEICAYIALDHPLDCVGAFKAEAAGIMLFDAMAGEDYNTLLGLPLIRLVSMLRQESVNPMLTAGT